MYWEHKTFAQQLPFEHIDKNVQNQVQLYQQDTSLMKISHLRLKIKQITEL